MKKVHKLSGIHRQLSIALALLLITMVITGCVCASIPIAGESSPVSFGTIDEQGNPAPGGAECTSGVKCENPGKGCSFIFAYKYHCTDTWNSETGECDCVCKSD